MLLLHSLFHLLTAINSIERPASMRIDLRSMGLPECSAEMQKPKPNLTMVLECLADSGNQTAFLEDTLWKIDLLLRNVDKWEKNRAPFQPSPYDDVDDALDIEPSVDRFTCDEKLNVVQAIRRKLFEVHMMDGEGSSLFKWPFGKPFNEWDQSTAPDTGGGPPLIDVNAFGPGDNIDDVTCLITNAIEAHYENKLDAERAAELRLAERKHPKVRSARTKSAKGKPAREKPAKEKPVKEKPVNEKPVQEKPAKEKPFKEKPVQEKPAKKKPVKEKPAKEKPVKEKLAKEKPAKEMPAKEKPAREKPAKEMPAKEKPAKGKPVKEKSAKEKAAKEKAAKEKSAKEKPAKEKPATEKRKRT